MVKERVSPAIVSVMESSHFVFSTDAHLCSVLVPFIGVRLAFVTIVTSSEVMNVQVCLWRGDRETLSHCSCISHTLAFAP